MEFTISDTTQNRKNKEQNPAPIYLFPNSAHKDTLFKLRFQFHVTARYIKKITQFLNH